MVLDTIIFNNGRYRVYTTITYSGEYVTGIETNGNTVILPWSSVRAIVNQSDVSLYRTLTT